MKKQLSLTTIVGLALAGSAYADNLPAPGKLTVGGVKVHALVDTYYQYNFNRTPTSTVRVGTANVVAGQDAAPQTTLRSYDTSHRSFEINQATVGLSSSASPVGFDVRIGVGNQLEILNANAGAAQAFEHLRKATVTWAPGALSLTAGRYDLEFGFERIDSVDNWNYGRSLAFTALQPRFMTGLLLGYDLGGGMSFNLGYGNGADRYVDNNKSGSYLASFGYDMNKTHFSFSWMGDVYRQDLGKEFRHYINANAKHMYSNTMGVGIDLSYLRGQNENTGNPRGTLKSTARYGAGVYGTVSAFADNWDTLRIEYLHDNDGAMTLRDSGSSFVTSTFTHKYKVTQNMNLLGELRWDWSNRGAFMDSGGTANMRDNQVTLLAAATFNI